MFDALSEKLKRVIRDLRGQSRLSAEHIEAAMREIRIALLEADVHFKVVKQFTETIKQKALGQDVLGSLSPAQQVVKIVYDELVQMLGSTSTHLMFTPRLPNVIMIVGLQGSGKTTTTGKLAHYLYKHNRNPLLLSTDVYRPAARQQLAIIARQVNRPVYDDSTTDDPLALARQARQHAELRGFDTLLVDTAGRLHIDEELMVELQDLKRELRPIEILFVADAMTGQDAVKSAEAFHSRLGLSGVILTKMDGDTRGGAALSIKAVIGQPIKFIGVGEKYDALELFYPDRIASRILGMGDVLSMVEKVQAEVDQAEAVRLEEKLRRNQFTLEDFRDQLKMAKRIGSLGKFLDFLPADLLRMIGIDKLTPEHMAMIDEQLKKTEAIINSMTPKERANEKIIDGSRRKRIARGSGTSVEDVNQLLIQYREMRTMMRHLTTGQIPTLGALGQPGVRKARRRRKNRRKR